MTEALQEKNRYARAPRTRDWTIDQDWTSYTPHEHARWRRLYERQELLLCGRACSAFLAAKEKLGLSPEGVPDFSELSVRLVRLTGWRIVPVAGLIPDDAFFGHLANRQFPAVAFIRPEWEFDYLSEPHVFHDVFGHVPLLADPVYGDFLEAYGKGGQRTVQRGQLRNLVRLYWYTVEFGLIAESGLRIFGAGILSSPGESVFALESASPNRVAFDLRRIMRTKYIISDYQQTYFVIDSFKSLLDQCYKDFDSLYDELRDQPDIEAHELIEGDRMITRGDEA